MASGLVFNELNLNLPSLICPTSVWRVNGTILIVQFTIFDPRYISRPSITIIVVIRFPINYAFPIASHVFRKKKRKCLAGKKLLLCPYQIRLQMRKPSPGDALPKVRKARYVSQVKALFDSVVLRFPSSSYYPICPPS